MANAQEAQNATAAPTAETVSSPESSGAAGPQASASGVDSVLNQCVKAHTAAQELLRTNDLLGSREAVVGCSDTRCPDVVRADCVSWTDDLQRRIPSVVFRVSVDGVDRRDLTVYLDGKKLSDELPTKALQINPGQHTFLFVCGRLARAQRVITIRQGESYTPVEAEMQTPAEEEATSINQAAGPTASMSASTLRRVRSRPIPWPAYALGGLAVAGGLGFAGFGLAAIFRERELRASCSPNCSESQVDEVRTRENLADLSLMIGVSALAGAATVYLTRPFETVRIEARTLPTGGLHGRVTWSWE